MTWLALLQEIESRSTHYEHQSCPPNSGIISNAAWFHRDCLSLPLASLHRTEHPEYVLTEIQYMIQWNQQKTFLTRMLIILKLFHTLFSQKYTTCTKLQQRCKIIVIHTFHSSSIQPVLYPWFSEAQYTACFVQHCQCWWALTQKEIPPPPVPARLSLTSIPTILTSWYIWKDT